MEKRLDKINEKISIYQYTDGFAYGTDAVLLSAFVKVKSGAVGAELGTGTGIIPILIAHHKKPSKIYAFEIQEDYVSLASDNVALCNMADKIEIVHENIMGITPSYMRRFGRESVDFVFTNPPYMKMTSGALNESERKLMARHELTCDISGVCEGASRLLKNGGDFFVVYRPDRLCDLFVAMRESGIEPKEVTFVSSREGEAPVLLLCRGKKSAMSALKINKPFIIYDKNGEPTEEMQRVYQCSLIGE